MLHPSCDEVGLGASYCGSRLEQDIQIVRMNGAKLRFFAIDPFGNILFSTNQNSDVDTLTLAQPGTYFLVIEGRRNAGAGSVNYAFNVVPDVASSTPLTIGNTVNGSISVPGESDDYTFTLGGATRVAFDTFTDVATLSAQPASVSRMGVRRGESRSATAVVTSSVERGSL